MRPTIKTTIRKDITSDVKARLARIAGDRVLVGIPEPRGPRKGTAPITNAQVMFIFSKGSPLRGQPARPVIEPAIMASDNRRRITVALGAAAGAELDGNHQEALDLLAKAGLAGSNAAKRWFTDPRNGWPPNKPSTVKRKLAKLRGAARKQVDAAVAAGEDLAQFDTVGIDTAQMRRALTYVVRG